MITSIVIIFLVVYLGMFLGELLYLQLDRTGVALRARSRSSPAPQ